MANQPTAAELQEQIAKLEAQLEAAAQREEQLQEQLEVLNQALDLAGVGEWVIDLESGQANPSERWWRLLGFEKGEYDEHLDNLKQLHHPEDWEQGWEMIAEHLTGKVPIYRNELRYLTKDQRWQWFRVAGQVLRRNSVGEPTLFAGMAQDITAERELAVRLEKNRVTLEKVITERDDELYQVCQTLDLARHEIETLSGILPICSCCKKVRDDQGYWDKLEAYIETHSKTEFTHGLCESCMQELYRDEGWFKRYQQTLKEAPQKKG